jgi:hypothetical protein
MKQSLLEDFFSKHSHKTPNLQSLPNDVNADWIVNRSGVPYLVLPILAPFNTMLDEARNLDSLFVEHRGNDSEGWASLAIHGISSQHTDHYQVYPEYAELTNDQVPYAWTEIKDRCPVTVDFFKNHFPYDVYHRVRFMRLSPGGYILPHSDSPDLGLRAVNFSLNNPNGCDFVFEENGKVPFQNSGSAIMVANGYKHSVWNRSNEYRYHIIIHGFARESYGKFESLLIKSYQSLAPMVV